MTNGLFSIFCPCIFGLTAYYSIINYVFKERLSSTDFNKDFISILIPARNEEKKLPNLLNNLIKKKDKNIEIIIYNDQSTVRTEEVVLEFMRKDDRIKLTNSDGLPEVWLGKNYACYNLANNADGDYLLFLDADVNVSSNVIRHAVTYLNKYNCGLLSIFPK